MAQFVHIFDAREQASIRRSGIKAGRHTRGVYCMPVMKDYTATHQWMRELRRFNKVPHKAVQFRIKDSEIVSIGRFNSESLDVTASIAVAIISRHKAPFGLEVVIPRAIKTSEIMKFYTPPKTVGWRYWPEAHGTEPCRCDYCLRGEPYSRRLMEQDI